MDNFDRAGRPGQTDAMALRLRANALAMAKLQLALVPAGLHGEAAEAWPEPEPAAEASEPPPPEPDSAGDPTDRMLAGDALSRFVSRRIDPDQSPHDAWRRSLQEAATPGRARGPALQRSPPC